MKAAIYTYEKRKENIILLSGKRISLKNFSATKVSNYPQPEEKRPNFMHKKNYESKREEKRRVRSHKEGEKRKMCQPKKQEPAYLEVLKNPNFSRF